MRLLTTSRGVFLGAALLSLAALTAGVTAFTAAAGASPLPRAVEPSVPILGQVALKDGNETDGASAVAALHGVRRIPGGTAIYYSIGFKASEGDSPSAMSLGRNSPSFSRSRSSLAFAASMLVDPAGRKVYTALLNADGKGARADCICSGNVGFSDYRAGQARVIYQVVAAVPESVQTVDVYIAGQVIGHVKVEAGPMTPEVDPGKPILVGTGWPKIDQSTVALSPEPARSVIDLKTTVADLEQTVTTRATPKEVSVALASDVLFATDSATLSSRAQAVLARAAAEVKAAGGNGALQIIGYTDDTGSSSHNVDLSGRRAAAVAAALKTLLPVGVQLQTSGKGEADPVAPNTSAEGRALNRRVSVVFAPQGGAK